jgi:hypothetical protein
MGYTIELSFDLVLHPNMSEKKKGIADLALDYNCDHYYYLYDMEANHKFPRNHCIIAVHFLDDDIFHCAEFLKKMRKMKKTEQLHIECIYEDDIACKLIYASIHYLKNIDRQSVRKYNKFKRERSYSDNESVLLNEMQQPCHPQQGDKGNLSLVITQSDI